ncbi:MAG TPA: hypothetical protein VI819_02000 [Patescibacteria group bacterium]|nr:hypothetical protein [Patescibacteria group bacterium]
MEREKVPQFEYAAVRTCSIYSRIRDFKGQRFEASASPLNIIEESIRLGIPSALTDHNFFGIWTYLSLCDLNKVRALPGIELPAVRRSFLSPPEKITFIAKSIEGLKNISDLASKNRNLNRDEIIQPDVITLVRGNFVEDEGLLREKGVFIAVDTPPSKDTLPNLLNLEQKYHKLVLTHPTVATEKDAHIYQILRKAFPSIPQLYEGLDLKLHTFPDKEEIYKLYHELGLDVIQRSFEITDGINVPIPQPKILEPEIMKWFDSGMSAGGVLRALIENKLSQKKVGPEVIERINMELRLINKYNLAGYILESYDHHLFCIDKNIANNIEGSGRNSQAVSVLFGTSDAMATNFDRFINEYRMGAVGMVDFPDIDRSVSDSGRPKLVKYATRSGRTHVLGIVSHLRKDSLKNSGLKDKDKEIIEKADIPEGKVIVHPGVVAVDIAPIYHSGVLQMQKKDAEDVIHAPKYDFPTNIGLGIVEEVNNTYEINTTQISKALDSIFYDRNSTIGIGTIESPTAMLAINHMGKSLKKAGRKPEFKDLSNIEGSIRPASAKAKSSLYQGIENITSIYAPYPELVKITKNTEGVFLYPEQIMQLVGSLGLGEENSYRVLKMLSKNLPGIEQDVLFVKIKNLIFSKYPKGISDQLFSDVFRVGYGFARGHSDAKTEEVLHEMVSKQEEPAEFWSSRLRRAATGRGGMYPLQVYLNAARRESGIGLLTPAKTLSKTYSENGKVILGYDLIGSNIIQKTAYNLLWVKKDAAVDSIDLGLHQMQHFGVSFTGDPSEEIFPDYQFEENKKLQKTIGSIASWRYFQPSQTHFVTLERNGLIHCKLDGNLYRNKKTELDLYFKKRNDREFLRTFLHVQIKKDEFYGGWEIVNLLPLPERIRE